MRHFLHLTRIVPEWVIRVGLLLFLLGVPTLCAILFVRYHIWTNFQMRS